MTTANCTASKPLTFDDIEAAKDFLEREVEVPEWCGHVTVRTLSMGGRHAINTGSIVGEGKTRRLDHNKFLALTLMYGIKAPKLTEAQADAMLAKSATAVQPIVDAIWEVSKLTTETAKNALPPA